jgi:CubicO group peptidase (beta-lactamase class C family)
MMLVEEGRMQLTDPVAKFLPPFAKMEVLVTDKEGRTTREIAKRQRDQSKGAMSVLAPWRHADRPSDSGLA